MLSSSILSLAVARGEGVAIAAPAGEIDVAVAPELVERLAELFDGGNRDVIVDLSDVTFLDVPGVRMLAEAAASAALSGSRLYLLRAEGQPRDIIERAGLGATFGLAGR
jgi:anti-sigma B factor antagonist